MAKTETLVVLNTLPGLQYVQFAAITSAKEVMKYPAFVSVFVCSPFSKFTQKLLTKSSWKFDQRCVLARKVQLNFESRRIWVQIWIQI